MNEFKYIDLANTLNEEHHLLLMKHKLHFRGNLKSISLISLHPKTPELGFSSIRTRQTALRKLDQIIANPNSLSLGRKTREKELQAWIIFNALSNQNKMYFDSSLRFISSELALYRGKSRVVNDLLAIDEENSLVVIELKSRREKKRLENQVDNYVNIIKANIPFFKKFIMINTGKQWNGKIKGVVIWPSSRLMKRVIKPEYREFVYLEQGEKGDKRIDYDGKGNIQFIEIE